MKALWAFEPFHQNKTKTKEMFETLKQLVGEDSNIEVGFVVTHDEPFINLSFQIPDEERFTTYPRKLVAERLRKSGLKIADKKINVVDFPTLSTTKAVDRFLKLAKDRDAELIGLFSRARKGLSRFVVGSFAETAIHRSQTSLLILNPNTTVAPKIKKIFFASDFSPSSKKVLPTVISYCQRTQAELIIFHHADMTYHWPPNEMSAENLAAKEKTDQVKKSIEAECQRNKISVEVIISSKFKATSDHIITHAKKKGADLVVVIAKSGPAAALIGGSVTRQIIRSIDIPVLILK